MTLGKQGMRTSGNSPSSRLFYEEVDWVLGTVPSTESTIVHNSLVSQVNLLTPDSRVGLEGKEQFARKLAEDSQEAEVAPETVLQPGQCGHTPGGFWDSDLSQTTQVEAFP
ncbi:unnamed protein product [Caretta caretta]